MCVVTCTRPAEAQVGQLAVGADAALVAYDSKDNAFGLGGDVRFGLRSGLPRQAFIDRIIFGAMIFQEELIVGYRSIPVFRSGQDPLKLGRAGGGMRIGVLRDLYEVLATGHVGVGFNDQRADFLWDAGGVFDWRFSSSSLGVHFAYYGYGSRENWFELGPHYEIRWLP
jgi:hypothetical protein